MVDQDKTKIVSHFRAVIERNEIRIKKQIKKNKNHQLIEKLSRENQRLKDKIYEFNS